MKIKVICTFIILFLVTFFLTGCSGTGQGVSAAGDCGDTIDNDYDGNEGIADKECSNPLDPTERCFASEGNYEEGENNVFTDAVNAYDLDCDLLVLDGDIKSDTLDIFRLNGVLKEEDKFWMKTHIYPPVKHNLYPDLILDRNLNLEASPSPNLNPVFAQVPYDLEDPFVVFSKSVNEPGGGGYFLSIASYPQFDVYQEQRVYINFNGIDETYFKWNLYGVNEKIEFPPFDITQITPEWAGWDNELAKETILEKIREDFNPYGIIIVSSDEAPLPIEGEPYTVVHIGNIYYEYALGIASRVDPWNSNFFDEAIIFALNFGGYAQGNPTFDEVMNKISNVASHEIGHTFGLSHVINFYDIMTPGYNDESAWFQKSLVHPDILHNLDELINEEIKQDAPKILNGVLVVE